LCERERGEASARGAVLDHRRGETARPGGKARARRLRIGRGRVVVRVVAASVADDLQGVEAHQKGGCACQKEKHIEQYHNQPPELFF
jgi:hypothetical protein